MTVNGQIRDWLDGSSHTVKGLSMAIDTLMDEIECNKSLLSKAKDLRVQLMVKEQLGLDHKGELLSVRCNGKTVTIGFIVGHGREAERLELKRLGFTWSKDKFEFNRKTAGINAQAVKDFIYQVEVMSRLQHNKNI